MQKQNPTVDQLINLARKNEEIASKLFEIEVEIMNVLNGTDFFEKLLKTVQESFNIDNVWLCLTEKTIKTQLAALFKAPDMPLHRAYICNTVDFLRVTKSCREPILVNSNLSFYKALVPAVIWPEVRSLAVLPLIVDGQLIGSLNFASEDDCRYEPSKDHFFLRQLAVKASICLSSVIAHERVSFLATRDSLTLLKNRREMEESLEKEISRCRRHNYDIAVLFIDCDDFKLVNDTYGHDCGDAYLKYVADNLTDMIRKGDTAFRFAGDEFVIILPNLARPGAEKIAQRIREHLQNTPLRNQDYSIPVHISFGAASSNELRELNSKNLLKEADARLYDMKELKPSKKMLEYLREKTQQPSSQDPVPGKH
ncbi:MAG: GGDEF domain-containing protein [Gammaproteobacteria bacterium]|nr:MAG: GGDEF domain-containing protein [Gammaproteobacteria bacterium]